MTDFIKLIRVYQYTKNLFVFAPLFFAGQLLHSEKLIQAAFAFGCFCLVSSSIYIINDYVDIDSDRLHPVKQNRPLASGRVNKVLALVVAMVFVLLGSGLSYWFNTHLFYVLSGYFVLNIFYCFYGKRIPLIDVFIISTGFVLRVVAGGEVSGIVLSHWLIILTFLLALFIAFAKRRDDMLKEEETGVKIRNSVSGYNMEFMTAVSSILNAVLIVCYIMYVTSAEVIARFNNKPVYLSMVFVLLGLFRYLQITMVEKNSGSPSKLVLKDRFLQVCIVLWGLFFLVLIYFKDKG
ncbi:MAG: decaprenyl-phosphate phosphoribosyltransferase [Sediminibacterium sp.]|nr:decaprenyl-phosphate phosphoribosyltransferase [Sediminibacterium sp.]